MISRGIVAEALATGETVLTASPSGPFAGVIQTHGLRRADQLVVKIRTISSNDVRV